MNDHLIRRTDLLPPALVAREPRKLVLRPEYCLGETLPSHVDRLANLHHTTLRDMLTRLGVIEEGRWREFSGYGVIQAEAARKRYSFVAELSEAEVADMLLTRYSGTVINLPEMKSGVGALVRKLAVYEWAYIKGSHFCTECIRESGGVWLSDWKLPWSFACARHGIMLHHTCPDCGRRPRAGRTSGLYPAFYEQIPDPSCCNNTRGVLGGEKRGRGISNSRPCGCSFVDLRGLVASKRTLDAQMCINLRLAKTARESDPKGTRSFFVEMRSVSALVLYVSEAEDFDIAEGEEWRALNDYMCRRAKMLENDMQGKSSKSHLNTMVGTPTNSALMAAVAQKALAILYPTSPEQLRDELRLLADRISHHPRVGSHRWQAPQLLRLPQRLRSELEKSMSTRGWFDRRVGFRSSSSNAVGALSYQACNVPQLISNEAYNLRFRRFFPGQRNEVGRRFCAVAAAKLLGFTWAQAAAALELPGAAVQTAQMTISKLNRSGTFNAFAEELRAWATELSQSSTLIDYQMRRLALGSAKDFEFSEWVALCGSVGFSPGRPGGRSRFAAAWMWADATNGDWHLSPAIQTRSRSNIGSQYKRMMRVIHPAMTQVLRAEAAQRIQSFESRLANKGVCTQRAK